LINYGLYETSSILDFRIVQEDKSVLDLSQERNKPAIPALEKWVTQRLSERAVLDKYFEFV